MRIYQVTIITRTAGQPNRVCQFPSAELARQFRDYCTRRGDWAVFVEDFVSTPTTPCFDYTAPSGRAWRVCCAIDWDIADNGARVCQGYKPVVLFDADGVGHSNEQFVAIEDLDADQWLGEAIELAHYTADMLASEAPRYEPEPGDFGLVG